MATSQVSFMKMLGVGLTLAILVDTTLIRAVFMRAAMRLMGSANWWAPARLRALRRTASGTEPCARDPGRAVSSGKRRADPCRT
jgi:putative drug exporter of the RND superfamily